jgi:RHS repeat-associated protein
VKTKEVAYTYDYLGRRIRKTLDSDGNGTVDDYFYDVHRGDELALEFRDQDGLAGQTYNPTVHHRYLYGAAVDQILAVENAASQVRFGLADHEGTIRDVVDAAAQLVNHVSYDSFGDHTGGTAPVVDFLFGFTGRPYDPDTDLYDYRARWYDAEVGRWVSEDPAGFDAGDMNLYRYAGNSPVIYVDPSGMAFDGFAKAQNPGEQVVRTYQVRSMWDDYDESVALGIHKPSWFERYVTAPIAKTLLPPSDPDTVTVYADGTRRINLGGGPSSGAMLGQAAMITGPFVAGTRGGAVAAGRELLSDVAQNTFTEVTGIPYLPLDLTPSVRSGRGIELPTNSGYTDDIGTLGSYLSRPTVSAKASAVEQQRNAFGQFLPMEPGQALPGTAAVDDFVAQAQKNGFDVVGRNISVNTPFGRRTYDAVIRNPQTGMVSGVEIKSSRSAFERFDPPARQQFAGDRWLRNEGGLDATGKAEGLFIDDAVKILWEVQ